MTVSFPNLNQFNRDLQRVLRVTRRSQEGILKKVSGDAFRGLVRRTPRDTGRARAGWIPTVERASEWKPPVGLGHYSVRPFDIGGQIRWNSSIHLTNNVEYIIPLDNGHSTIQAPTGIVDYVFAEMAAQMRALLRAERRRTVR